MNYSEEQRQVIFEDSDRVQVVAGAGSGKTFTMVSLICRLLEEGREKPSEILVITFSRKAAEEISERIERRVGKTDVRVHTFHAYCLQVIRKFHPEYSRNLPEIISDAERDSFMKNFFHSHRFRVGGIPFEFLLSEQDRILEKYFPDLDSLLRVSFSEYKIQNARLEFSDLVKIFLDGMSLKEDWAMNAASEIRRVIVDEFQDTDPEQMEWLRLLNPEKLTVVGDDWQAIYGFRGASTKPFLEFSKVFSPCRVLFLSNNYRSLSDIIRTSALPISMNRNNIQKSAVPVREGTGTVQKYFIREETDWNLLKEHMNGKEFRVLCRTNFRKKTLSKYGFAEDALLTVHASKGLEFHSVVLDLTSGWSSDSEISEEQKEEERRILYVALSRAKDELIIAGKYRPDKKEKKFLESEFFQYFKGLDELRLFPDA